MQVELRSHGKMLPWSLHLNLEELPVSVALSSCSIRVAMLEENGERVLMEGKLTHKINTESSLWSLEPGKCVLVSLGTFAQGSQYWGWLACPLKCSPGCLDCTNGPVILGLLSPWTESSSVPKARQLACAPSSFLPTIGGADRLSSTLLWAAALLRGLLDMAMLEMVVVTTAHNNADLWRVLRSRFYSSVAHIPLGAGAEQVPWTSATLSSYLDWILHWVSEDNPARLVSSVPFSGFEDELPEVISEASQKRYSKCGQ
ncbi:hypothetical protein P7K49_024978 [Saguinus oedipus]|uniref:CS domain-containing protein n=1 Tax=Saguinus oedipus TaxID=9490 RepID=A0ABQ9UFS5_SAGOE|nr:hypothetical protein P7K49_024978 [Saguinus oedipus]